MFTILFWKATAERAVKSAAQAGVIVWAGVSLTSAHDIVNAGEAVGLAALSGLVLSVLTSIGSAALTDGSPSLTNSEVLPTAGE